jgi:hypothetical protein
VEVWDQLADECKRVLIEMVQASLSAQETEIGCPERVED